MIRASDPIVSVVVATRDRPQSLPATLHAIAAQDFEDIEVMVVDDGSSDETLAAYEDVLSSLDKRFRFDKPPAPTPWGSGPGATRNRGIRAARGRYVAFCDDDDVWLARDHLSVAVDALDRTGAEFFFANLRTERLGEVVDKEWLDASREIPARDELLHEPPILRVRLQTTLSERRFPPLDVCVIRREVLVEMGGFWEPLRYLEDWDLVFRLFDRADLCLFRPEVVALHNISVPDDEMERHLVTIMAAQHLKTHCNNPYLRKITSEWEAAYLSRIGRWVLDDGRPDAALGIIAQAALADPSLRWAPFAAEAMVASVKQRIRGGR